MAYDPNDAADKKIVADLVKAAVAKREEELGSEHEADKAGLIKKRDELLAKVKELGKGVPDAAELERVEAQLETTKAELKEAKKIATKAQNDLKDATEELNIERTTATESLVKSNLTEELTKAKVAPAFIPAVTALLRPQVVVKVEGGEKKVFVGDKPLSEHITNWSQSDEGKAYVSATINGGTGAPGGPKGNGNTGLKSITRAEYDAMPIAQQGAVMSKGETQIVDA